VCVCCRRVLPTAEYKDAPWFPAGEPCDRAVPLLEGAVAAAQVGFARRPVSFLRYGRVRLIRARASPLLRCEYHKAYAIVPPEEGSGMSFSFKTTQEAAEQAVAATEATAPLPPPAPAGPPEPAAADAAAEEPAGQ